MARHDMQARPASRLDMGAQRPSVAHTPGHPVHPVECSPNHWRRRTRRRPRVRAVHGAAPPCLSPIRRALHFREPESIRSLEVAAARQRAASGVSPLGELPAVPVRDPLQEADDPRGLGPRLRRPRSHLQLFRASRTTSRASSRRRQVALEDFFRLGLPAAPRARVRSCC